MSVDVKRISEQILIRRGPESSPRCSDPWESIRGSGIRDGLFAALPPSIRKDMGEDHLIDIFSSYSIIEQTWLSAHEHGALFLPVRHAAM